MINDMPALLGGPPVNDRPLPVYNTIGEEEKRAVMEVLDSGVLSGFAAQPNDDHLGGKIVRGLEESFCCTFGTRYAVAVNSATSALHAAVSAMKIGPGDEVIVPPYTMTASATAVLFTGAVPIFADIDDEIFCLDPRSVEERITPRTKGIMAVNLYGHPAPLFELKRIADKHGLFLIEDNAQAPLATIDGRYAGTIGDAGIFSLNRHKTMQCGEGGVIITDSEDVADRCRLVRNHGEVLVGALGVEDIANTIGLNYRITNMEAAVARVQFEKLPALTRPRVQLADRLREGLSKIPGITPPVVRDGCTHVYYFFTMKYDEQITCLPRQLFADAVRAEGFPIAAGYVKPLYLEPLYQQRIGFGRNGAPFSLNPHIDETTYRRGICPVVERLQDSELLWTNITYPPLTEKEMDGFVEACAKVLRNRDKLIAEAHKSAAE
jgi:perosamine synthetase